MTGHTSDSLIAVLFSLFDVLLLLLRECKNMTGKIMKDGCYYCKS